MVEKYRHDFFGVAFVLYQALVAFDLPTEIGLHPVVSSDFVDPDYLECDHLKSTLKPLLFPQFVSQRASSIVILLAQKSRRDVCAIL